MQSVSKIGFKSGNTNLLQQVKVNTEPTPVKEKEPQVLPENTTKRKALLNELTTDVYQNKDKLSFIKEYSGIAALAVSLIGLPVTYAVTKKAGSKTANKAYEDTLNKLSQKIDNLNIEGKVKEAVENTLGNSNKVQKMLSQKSNLITVLLGLGTGFGIGEFVKNNRDSLKEQGFKDDEINEAQRIATNIIENPQKALDKANEAHNIASGINGKTEHAVNAANQALSTANHAMSTANSMDGRINEARNRADEALGSINSGLKPEMLKHVEKYYDLWLMKYNGWEEKINNDRTEEAISTINNAAKTRLHRSADDTIKDIKAYKDKYNDKLTSTWAITAEFQPIKIGGLGEVPVDIQNNFTKLGIDNPVFIPMYEAPGVSKFISDGHSKFEYLYGNQDKQKHFDLKPLADMEIEVFKDGKITTQPVQFFVHEDNGKKLIFVRNQSFKGALYDSTMYADEPEKFAVLSKAVYNLAKSKVADAFGQPLFATTKITTYPEYDKLGAPNSMILNDWHAAPVAGLMRYKSAMEYNYNELAENVFNAMTNMPLLMIGHNLNYQGASNSTNGGNITAKNNITQNIINTLYDKYAIGITENANSGIGIKDLDNTILLKRETADKQFNSLFHGIALADWFVPVSKNYSTEIVNDAMQSGIARPLLELRKPTGTIEGIINGTDLFKHNMHAVKENNGVKSLVLKEYDKNTDISDIMKAREENKRMFFRAYLTPLLNGVKKDKLELIKAPNQKTQNITEEEFMQAPLVSFAHRLTSQKGLVLLKGAIFRLFDNWENEFGDLPKPYFLVGGPDPSRADNQHLYDLKNPEYGTNKERIDHVICLKGRLPNPAIMSASTFFCAPSIFEPCGLTQGECFAKGTPVITTDTGGFHDTIEDGKTGFLAPQISEESVYETLVKALKMYYYDNESYQQMIKNDLEIDFSWAKSGKNGPIYEYTDRLGFDRKDLPDIANKRTK